MPLTSTAFSHQLYLPSHMFILYLQHPHPCLKENFYLICCGQIQKEYLISMIREWTLLVYKTMLRLKMVMKDIVIETEMEIPHFNLIIVLHLTWMVMLFQIYTYQSSLNVTHSTLHLKQFRDNTLSRHMIHLSMCHQMVDSTDNHCFPCPGKASTISTSQTFII